MLTYSIEQLVHFTCRCGYSWTHHGELPEFEVIHCPRCNEHYYQSEIQDITHLMPEYCTVHEIWSKTTCPLCKVASVQD